ncbi:MAG: hypothetical protein FJ264_02070 [Planctomycetes bacterium]|nr:hypothetical protein [Planctomycetota bacterium]
MNNSIYHLNLRHKNIFFFFNRRNFAYGQCFFVFLIFFFTFLSFHIFDLTSLSHDVHAAQVTIDDSVSTTTGEHNGSSPTSVFISDQTGYVFYIDSDSTCKYSKTTNGGSSWGSPVTVDSQTDCLHVAIWYDRWTPGDSSGNYIHILTIDSGSDDLFYTRLDTSSDTLTTTVNATGANQGGTFANANIPSITKGTDGDLYMGVQDGGDSFVIKCTGNCNNAGNWSEAGVNPFDTADDYLILMPLSGGNIMAIRWDISADDIQSKVFNDSTSAWDAGWTNIDTDAAENGTYDGAFGATVNKSNNNIYLVYAVDEADDDIRAALYSGGSWTSKTDVLTNDSKGITGAKISLDESSGDVYVVYTARTTRGSAGTGNVYFKRSVDGMASWGAEQGPVNSDADDLFGARVNIMSGERIYVSWYGATPDDLFGNTIIDLPLTVQFSASSQSGSESIGSLAITPQLSAVTGLNVTVPFTVSGTAVSPADYSITSSPVTIAAGTTTTTITITVVDDAIDEIDETVIVTMGIPTNATAGTTTVHTATIIDNDGAPSVTLSLSGSPMAEAGGSSTVTATLSNLSSSTVTVNLAFSGTATLNDDYTRSGTSISITAGNTNGSITLTAVQDDNDESDETIIVDIDSVTNATESGTQQVIAVITDDDEPPPPPPPPFEFYVTNTTPDDGATDVAINTTVSATFNAYVKGSTVTTDTFMVSAGEDAVSGEVSTEGETIQFTPSDNLAYNTVYTATIRGGTAGVTAANYAGTAMDSDYVWDFTTVPDTTAPAGSIAINSGSSHTNSTAATLALLATDNVGVTGYFISTSSATPSSSDLNWVSVNATAHFAKNISYTLTSGDGDKTIYVWYKDAANNVSDAASDSIVLDTTAPVIISTRPANEATEVSPVITEITATFSEAMDAATVGKSTFTLSGGITGTVKYNNTTAAFAPYGKLDHSTQYTATITKDVKDLAGNVMASNYSWSFTTSTDTTAPVGTVKINNDATYANSSTVTLSLSATDVVGVTGYFLSSDFSAPSPTAAGWVSVDSTKSLSKDVSHTLRGGDGNKVIFAWYKDDAGNVSGAASDSIIMDTTPPAVITASPGDGETEVSIGSIITATFSENMDAATINASSFVLSNEITGTIGYNNTTATFIPSANLDYSTTYAATINTAAKDVAGNAMATDYTWSFTTEPDAIAPAGIMTVNNDDVYANSTAVTLHLSATDNAGVTGYYASNSSTAPLSSDVGWVSVNSAASYTEDVLHSLNSGDGTKTAYVWYKDAGENISEEASDSIVLDMTSPIVSITSVSFGISSDDTLLAEKISYPIHNNYRDGKRIVRIENIAENIHGLANNDEDTISITANLKGSAKDSLSGINRVTWVNDKGGSGTATGTTDWSISNILLSSDGDNNITVTAFDNANNTGAETVTVSFGGGTPVPTPTPEIVLKLSKEVAYLSGDTVVVTVKDADRNTNPATVDIVNTAIKISASYFTGNDLLLDLNENAVNSGTFLATIETGTTTSGGAGATERSNNGTIKTVQGGTATVTYTDVSPDAATYTRSLAFSSFDAAIAFDADTYLLNSSAGITLSDAERNADHTEAESLLNDVFIETSLSNITRVRMTETGADTGAFAGSIRIVESGGTLEYERIQAAGGETLTVTYGDEINTTGFLRTVTDMASVADSMPTPIITTTPTPVACIAASIVAYPEEVEIVKNESKEVTVTVTGKDDCPVKGVKVKRKISQRNNKKIEVTPSKQKTDENGQATFTIKAKKGNGTATVTFKAKDVKEKAGVTVNLTKE